MAKQKLNGGATVMLAARNPASTAERPIVSIKTNDKGQIFSHIRQRWLVETPEERVRQAYVVILHNEYGFDLDQMDEELHVTGRGAGKARADVSIWRTARDKSERKPPLIVVECKADNITIKAEDYSQGEHYALLTNAPFFVTHNNRETRYGEPARTGCPGIARKSRTSIHCKNSFAKPRTHTARIASSMSANGLT